MLKFMRTLLELQASGPGVAVGLRLRVGEAVMFEQILEDQISRHGFPRFEIVLIYSRESLVKRTS